MKKLWLTYAICLWAATAQAVTRTVCNSGCDYTSLTAAYAALACGDVIQMKEPSTASAGLSYALSKACTAGNTITIEAFAGVTPTFNDTGASWNDGVFYVTGDYHIIDGMTINGTRHGNGLQILGDHNIVRDSTFANISTDDYPGGANATSLLITGGQFNVVQANTFGDGCDHDAIGVKTGANYNQILNNTIECDHGHGISLLFDANYNLVDGNIVTYIGNLCSGADCAGKQFLQISGASNNSVRRNVVYDLYNRAIELDVLSASYGNANGNLIYNNTFYNITTRLTAGNNDTIHMGTSDNASTEHVEDNIIANNIFDKVAQQVYTDFSSRNVVVMMYYTVEQDLGDNLNEVSVTNDWRGNRLLNNVMRPYYSGSYQPTAAYAISYSNAGGGYQPSWTVTGINGVGSQSGNATSDPEFVSTDTATAGWWHLQATSVLINAGVEVSDTNGSYVEANFPGFGWSNLSYSGAAPDIGAYEYNTGAVTIGGGSKSITVGGGAQTITISP